jgi:threonyl-tRNA synthetase
VNEEGKKEVPVVIHRAISGSLERFLGVAIEHFAGAFPLWFAPEQIALIPVADAHMSYTQEVQSALHTAGFRTSLQPADESLGKRIRIAKGMKVPYILVIGDAEKSTQSVSIESRDTGVKGVVETVDAFIARITVEQENRALLTT